MERPKLLVLIRHAESKRNKQMEGMKIFLSESDKKDIGTFLDFNIPLTSVGVDQAKRVGRALRDEFGVFDILIHSGYVRSRETAHFIFMSYSVEERKCITMVQNLLVRERDSGYTFSMTREEVMRFFPFLQNHWDIQGHLFGVPPGGESIMAVTTRAAIAFESLYRDYPDKKICIVTHGNFIRCARGVLEEIPIETMFQETRKSPPNCSVTAYTFDGKRIPKCLMHEHVF